MSRFKLDTTSTKFGSQVSGHSGSAAQRWTPFLLVVAAAVLFHLVKVFLPDAGRTALANFSPFMALAVCGGLLFPRFWMALVPLCLLAIADLVDPVGGVTPVFALYKYGAFAAAIGIGFLVRGRVGLGGTFATVAVCGLGYYLLLNTAAWSVTPGYARNLAGWWQAQTIGLPGFPPSWLFLRNQLAGDLAFTSLVLVVFGLLRPRLTPAQTENATVSA